MRALARSARCFFQRPLLGRWSASSVETSRGPSTIVRDAKPSSLGSPSLITPTCPLYAALDAAGVLIFAVAKAPDFDSFFGGLEAAIASGGVLLTALVVVVAIKKLFAGA
jgi:hypothetical protein